MYYETKGLIYNILYSKIIIYKIIYIHFNICLSVYIIYMYNIRTILLKTVFPKVARCADNE